MSARIEYKPGQAMFESRYGRYGDSLRSGRPLMVVGDVHLAEARPKSGEPVDRRILWV
ncbi:MAG: hypothetical protein OXF02_00385 [Simkaniaceae bacterium]|nr:hypothetical protein [Simkaniaceae bacterium]